MTSTCRVSVIVKALNEQEASLSAKYMNQLLAAAKAQPDLRIALLNWGALDGAKLAEAGLHELVAAGYAVVATDYSGMGADGPPAYLIGVTEGNNVLDIVRAGRSFASFEDGAVVFKAEVGAATPRACQIQGVWVDPDHRGRGLAVPAMASVVHLTREHVAPVVSLYVNDYNAAALAGLSLLAGCSSGPRPDDFTATMPEDIPVAEAANGAICTLSLSFNNDGPLGTFFRYIGDTGTYIARYDDLFNGKEEKIDVSQVAVSMNGIELQDREFFAAIREGREPNGSVAQVLPCYEVLHQLEQQLQ